ncbi:hypothetical protein [Adlercreutzia sp. ZJ154]|uniref:Cap15 family cyclic dinucleotide receptor domain-containing protein n=1 Tax=Adlercreutzia sp. ZJ154 TaxID=2709790 RepID=UPI0013EAC905|nr:hypothetical protein [Adlercreutzia sp. ZJ154]
MSERSKQYSKAISVVAMVSFICVYGAHILIEGIENLAFSDYLAFISEATTATLAICVIYCKWIWRYLNIFHIPKLFKHYDGVLVSDCDSKERSISLNIIQHFDKVEICMKSDESESISTSADFEQHRERYMLVYEYINTPKAKLRDNSPIHFGTARLKVENDGRKLIGEYYTSRNTKGDISLDAADTK